MKSITFIQRILTTNAPASVLLIRVVGAVFLSEGIQKFLFPNELGVGRFIKIGISAPRAMAPPVGLVEIVCGTFVILGLLTRLAAIPLSINIFVAISATKVPMLIRTGFWAMAHEARTDYSLLLGSIFLLIVGAGAWSIDMRLALRESRAHF